MSLVSSQFYWVLISMWAYFHLVNKGELYYYYYKHSYIVAVAAK